MRQKHLILVGLLCVLGFVSSCGGGGGGGDAGTPAPTYPTDANTITTTTTRQFVQSAATVFAPDTGYSSPKTMMRTGGRSTARAAQTMTSNLDQLTGTVGETFTMTYTDEPADDCTLNGTINGTVASITSSQATITLTGTMYFTQCADKPDNTATIESGSIIVTATNVAFSMRNNFAFNGISYTASVVISQNYYNPESDGADVYYLGSESFEGADSLGNAIVEGTSFNTSGYPSTYSNATLIDGTRNQIACTFYHTNLIMRCSGNATLSNGIVLTYPNNAWNFSYTESMTSDDDMVAYSYELGAGSGTFTSNTGYTGTITVNADGTGSGTVKDASGATVSAFTWDANGLCSVDYADASIADAQYYLTNVMAAMNP